MCLSLGLPAATGHYQLWFSRRREYYLRHNVYYLTPAMCPPVSCQVSAFSDLRFIVHRSSFRLPCLKLRTESPSERFGGAAPRVSLLRPVLRTLARGAAVFRGGGPTKKRRGGSASLPIRPSSSHKLSSVRSRNPSSPRGAGGGDVSPRLLAAHDSKPERACKGRVTGWH